MPQAPYQNAVLIAEIVGPDCVIVRNKQSGDRPEEMLSLQILLFGSKFKVTPLNGELVPTTPSHGLPTFLLARKEAVEVA